MTFTTTGQLWLMEEHAAKALCERLAKLDFPTAKQLAKFQAANGTKAMRRVSGRVAVIPIHGPIEQRASVWSYLFGGANCESLDKEISAAVADNGVGAIVLDVNSPGGTAGGIEVLADSIYAARGKKPMHAVCTGQMCSAAYWLGSAVDSVTAMPGSEVGSIGVYMLHADISKMLENEGVSATLIKSDKYKAETTNIMPLSEDAKEHLQSTVDELADDFVKAVARNRGVAPAVVRATYGQGRVFSAKQGVAAGMIDKIGTLNSVVEKLSGALPPAAQQRRASVEVLRARAIHERAKTGERAKAGA